MKIQILVLLFLAELIVGCQAIESSNNVEVLVDTNVSAPKGMVWVSGKNFYMGANPEDTLALPREKPRHKVAVDGFFIDENEVTNAQFKAFVAATNYVTVAERPVDWEELKKTLPPGTPRPDDSVLQPGSLSFNSKLQSVDNMYDISQWWAWQTGANWKHPQGANSTIDGLDDHPVVHIAYEDALAYCDWANRRLPTEAEWELAALGQLTESIYTWGNDVSPLCKEANTWQGVFPIKNTPEDGFALIAPVKSYPSNTIGVFDMAGNVWEWTQDWFNTGYYEERKQNGVAHNPTGATRSYNQANPYQQEKVIKGGSFLCHDSYCASYRISSRMGMTPDSASDHLGFRTVATPDMLGG